MDNVSKAIGLVTTLSPTEDASNALNRILQRPYVIESFDFKMIPQGDSLPSQSIFDILVKTSNDLSYKDHLGSDEIHVDWMPFYGYGEWSFGNTLKRFNELIEQRIDANPILKSDWDLVLKQGVVLIFDYMDFEEKSEHLVDAEDVLLVKDSLPNGFTYHQEFIEHKDVTQENINALNEVATKYKLPKFSSSGLTLIPYQKLINAPK